MMNAMMHAMIRNMSVDERENMMLEMMPEMMKQAELKPLMRNSLEIMGSAMSLYTVYRFIETAAKDRELREIVAGGLKGMMSKMQQMMPEMMPMMMPVMKSVMPKMMSFMMPMMSGMMSDMARNEEDCIMLDMVDENPEMQEHMGGMMFDMCPKMAGKVMPKENSVEFVNRMEKAVLTDRGIAR